MWNFKNDTNELIYKTETDSQIQKTNLLLPQGKGTGILGVWDQHKHAAAAATKSRQSCLTLYDPMDGSPPGSPGPGILQARTLQWGAIAFSSA